MDSVDDGAFDFCFREFSTPTKWSACDLIINVSKKFPEQTFLFAEIREGKEFSNYLYKNGVGLNYDFVMGPPKFPSKKQWGDALNRLEEYKSKQKLKQEAAAKEKQEAERIALIERTKREIEEKQELLKNLV
jgi:hypothetical protein